MSPLKAVLLLAPTLLLAFACHDDRAAFATFQACFDEQTIVVELPFQEAVVTCCLDHPIAGDAEPCGTSAAECLGYLTANLSSTATTTEVGAACDAYVRQRDM